MKMRRNHLLSDDSKLNSPRAKLQPAKVEEFRVGPRKKPYPGVFPFKGRFAARMHAVGRRWNCGTWDTEKEAATALDRARLYLRVDPRRLFFPGLARRLGATSPVALVREAMLKKKRLAKRGSSRYIGVHWYTRDGLWKASFHYGGRVYQLGRFESARQAAIARDRVALRFRGDKAILNFPSVELRPATIDEVRPKRVRRRVRYNREAEGLFGVQLHNQGSRAWVATTVVSLRHYHLGTWKTPQLAAIAHDRALLFYVGESAKNLNDPDEARRHGAADAPTLRALARREFKEQTTSRLRGVWWAEGRKVWLARLMVDRRIHHLGRFSDEISAARAYDRAARRLLRDRALLNFDPKTGEELLGMKLRE